MKFCGSVLAGAGGLATRVPTLMSTTGRLRAEPCQPTCDRWNKQTLQRQINQMDLSRFEMYFFTDVDLICLKIDIMAQIKILIFFANDILCWTPGCNYVLIDGINRPWSTKLTHYICLIKNRFVHWLLLFLCWNAYQSGACTGKS